MQSVEHHHQVVLDRQDFHKSKPHFEGGNNCHQQPPTNRFMFRLLPWCKLKKTKMRDSSASCDDVSSVIITRDQASRIYGTKCIKVTKPQATNPDVNANKKNYPVVAFVNKGDGLVSVDLMDRVMVNENELYSMSMVTGSSNFSSVHSLSNMSSSMSSKFSFPPTPPLRNDSLDDCDNQIPDWFYGSVCRDAAMNILQKESIGAFVVRDSTSKPGCYALSVRVPKQFHASGVAHYLIIRSTKGTFKIKGFTKEFSSLHSLIVHHSIMQELLPCPLNLAVVKRRKIQKKKPVAADPPEVKKIVEDEDAIAPCDSEVLVDIDSDPDYQRILSSFRKTMATCK